MHGAIEQVFRRQKAQLVATLTRILRDVHRAEELAQDALVAALEKWPFTGIPDNPPAWLMTAARNAALSELRHRRRAHAKEDALGWHVELTQNDSAIDETPEQIADDQLRLIFTCCHPALSHDARVALTLRLLGGLSTEEIARAFLASEPTIAQRIVRAKRTIAEQGLQYETPALSELGERLPAVLEVLYLIFNEGYSASGGDALIRKELCDEAIRLTRLVASLVPDEGEVLGLLALLELQASRREARVDDNGELVLLADQDRSKWDRAAIDRAAAIMRAPHAPGPYWLQAHIALLYASASSFETTNFAAIAALYGALAIVAPSPVVDLNRAVAIGLAEGPEAGLRALDAVDGKSLRDYHLYPAARGDFLRRLGRGPEAAAAYREAIVNVGNDRERAFLERRLLEV
jgi:RNA polymerase sigma factor (sigma-70 family)